MLERDALNCLLILFYVKTRTKFLKKQSHFWIMSFTVIYSGFSTFFKLTKALQCPHSKKTGIVQFWRKQYLGPTHWDRIVKQCSFPFKRSPARLINLLKGTCNFPSKEVNGQCYNHICVFSAQGLSRHVKEDWWCSHWAITFIYLSP